MREGVIDRRERLEKGPTKATGGREEGDNQEDIIIIIGNKGRAQTDLHKR